MKNFGPAFLQMGEPHSISPTETCPIGPQRCPFATACVKKLIPLHQGVVIPMSPSGDAACPVTVHALPQLFNYPKSASAARCSQFNGSSILLPSSRGITIAIH